MLQILASSGSCEFNSAISQFKPPPPPLGTLGLNVQGFVRGKVKLEEGEMVRMREGKGVQAMGRGGGRDLASAVTLIFSDLEGWLSFLFPLILNPAYKGLSVHLIFFVKYIFLKLSVFLLICKHE